MKKIAVKRQFKLKNRIKGRENQQNIANYLKAF